MSDKTGLAVFTWISVLEKEMSDLTIINNQHCRRQMFL